MKKKQTKTSSLMHHALAFAFVTLFTISCDSKQSNTTSSSNDEKKPNSEAPQVQEKPKDESIQIAAKALTAEYEANEVAADSKYKEKTLEVTGTITQISKDIADDIYVTLSGDNDFREVQCYFEDKATAVKLQKGMKVTFKGTCDGLLMNVLMKDCVLVN